MNVFVIVVTYNGMQWYDRCFSSLRVSEIPLNVVSIDNASSDDTVNYLKSNFHENYMIESATNLGFGQANNKGIRYALDNGADYVFLLNQDAWIEPNTIAELVKIHQSNPTYGILCPIHLNANRTAIEKDLLHWIADYKVTDSTFLSDLYCKQKLKDIYRTSYVNAAAWLIPKNTLKTIGGFDPVFFHYGEDDNYISRARYHGLYIGLCPSITVCHDTERRLEVTSDIQKNSWKKELLIDITNIYQETNITFLLMYHIRKIIILLCTAQIKSAKYMYARFRLLVVYKKQAKASKKQNKCIGPSWL